MTLRFTDPDHLRLLDAIVEGNIAALKTMYDLTAPTLCSALRRHIDDDQAIEGIVTDLFIAIWARPHAFCGQTKARARKRREPA